MEAFFKKYGCLLTSSLRLYEWAHVNLCVSVHVRPNAPHAGESAMTPLHEEDHCVSDSTYMGNVLQYTRSIAVHVCSACHGTAQTLLAPSPNDNIFCQCTLQLQIYVGMYSSMHTVAVHAPTKARQTAHALLRVSRNKTVSAHALPLHTWPHSHA